MDLSVGNAFTSPQISQRLNNQLGHIERAARRASRKAIAWLAHRRVWSPRMSAPWAGPQIGAWTIRGIAPSASLYAELTAAQREIRSRTGFDVAIGAAKSPNVARMASRSGAAGNVTVVKPGQERAFLAGLELNRLEGLSASTTAILRTTGMVTIGELQRVPKPALQAEFGREEGLHIWRTARGIDRSHPAQSRHVFVGARRAVPAFCSLVQAYTRRALPARDTPPPCHATQPLALDALSVSQTSITPSAAPIS
jgi:nucleotidyltransferase/DNA polymerase involved in DNA repair